MIARLKFAAWLMVVVLVLSALVLPFLIGFLALLVLAAAMFFAAYLFIKIGKGRA
jgi:hypothetical protein